MTLDPLNRAIPLSAPASIDTVLEAAKLAAAKHPYKHVRVVMYSPFSGQTLFQKIVRGGLIQSRDQGYYPLGLFGWYDKDENLLQPVAHIFPWLREDGLAAEIFGMICDAETLRIRELYEKRELN